MVRQIKPSIPLFLTFSYPHTYVLLCISSPCAWSSQLQESRGKWQQTLFQSLLPGRMFLERQVNPEWSVLGLLCSNPQGGIIQTASVLWLRSESKVKPSQVNIEPGVKTPPDIIHKQQLLKRTWRPHSWAIALIKVSSREMVREGKSNIPGVWPGLHVHTHQTFLKKCKRDYSEVVRKQKAQRKERYGASGTGGGNGVSLDPSLQLRSSWNCLTVQRYHLGNLVPTRLRF